MEASIIEKMRALIPQSITTDQAKDTGMAMVLICLLIAFFADKQYFYNLAIMLILINMIWPNAFKPLAKVWLGFSHVLGSVMSRIMLSIIFLIIVLPVGLLRRAMGKDSLQLKKWKRDNTSVFKIRNHELTSEDIKHPY